LLNLSWSGTELMLRYLRLVQSGEPVPEDLLDDITADPGYAFFLRRNREMTLTMGSGDTRGLDKEGMIRFLRQYALDRGRSEHRLFGRLAEAMDRALGQLDEHEKVLDALRRLDPGAMEGDVLSHLPRGASIDATVYFLAEAHTNAYVYEGDTVVSFFPLILAEDRVHLSGVGALEAVLKHELHHLGLRSLLPGGSHEPETAEAFALDLLHGVIAEGAATLFFSPPDALPDRSSWDRTARHLLDHYRALEQILLSVLDGETSPSEANRAAFDRLVGPFEGSHPAIYPLGLDLCGAVLRGYGRDVMIDRLSSPVAFLQAYQQLSEGEKTYDFSDRLVKRLSEWDGS